jgi:nucleoside-diphosphate-sugar epimerase
MDTRGSTGLSVFSSVGSSQQKKKRILLTGATGIVGSQLLTELLKQNGVERIICLVRGKSEPLAHERVERIIGSLPDFCSIIVGDITQPLCGLTHEQVKALATEKIDVYLHCAACTKMDLAKQREIFETNVIGTGNLISMKRLAEYFSEQPSAYFHHVSTAYLSDGGDDSFGMNNPYEVSKYMAELEVMTSQMPFMISRIPIVIGRSIDGWIADHSGYGGFMSVFHRVAEKIRQQSGQNSGSDVFLPLTIECSEDSNLNLVTVDWVAEMLAHVTYMKPQNKTVYLVHPNPPNARWALRKGLECLGIRGVKFGNQPFADEPHHAQQAIILKLIGPPFKPYLTKVARFHARAGRAFEIIGPPYREHLDITRELIERVVSFGRDTNFESGLSMPGRQKEALHI